MIPHATHTAHRKAFGPGKKRSEATKALHVAESILQYEDRHEPWDFQRTFGVDPASPYGELVRALLRAKRQQEAVPVSESFIECGCCGAYHRSTYYGDCRNDAERFNDIPAAAQIVAA